MRDPLIPPSSERFQLLLESLDSTVRFSFGSFPPTVSRKLTDRQPRLFARFLRFLGPWRVCQYADVQQDVLVQGPSHLLPEAPCCGAQQLHMRVVQEQELVFLPLPVQPQVLAFDPVEDVTEDRMAAIRFGFNLRNTATFPITFKIDNLKSKLTQGNNTLYPPNKEYVNNGISIPPGGTGFFDDYNIVLPNDFNGNTSAELQCKVFYGKADRFDHEFELNKVTSINFTGSVISGGQHWYDQ